jgi:hypothetical protein
MEIVTFKIVCVPSARLNRDANTPAMMYFLKPKTPQMATAIGADN